MFNKLIPLKCYWDTPQRKMLCCWLLNSHKYYQNIARAWCKTIVTPYIKWGSYNSFCTKPSIDSVVVVEIKTCYRTVIVVIYWVVVGNLSLISEAECCYISTFLMCDVCWSMMLFKKAVNIEVCKVQDSKDNFFL